MCNKVLKKVPRDGSPRSKRPKNSHFRDETQVVSEKWKLLPFTVLMKSTFLSLRGKILSDATQPSASHRDEISRTRIRSSYGFTGLHIPKIALFVHVSPSTLRQQNSIMCSICVIGVIVVIIGCWSCKSYQSGSDFSQWSRDCGGTDGSTCHPRQ